MKDLSSLIDQNGFGVTLTTRVLYMLNRFSSFFFNIIQSKNCNLKKYVYPLFYYGKQQKQDFEQKYSMKLNCFLMLNHSITADAEKCVLYICRMQIR